MSVAIIGAGPSGLVAAKSSIESGLKPKVFEKSGDLGGIWHPINGSTWDSMTTNLSKYSCMFSDFPWSEKESDFPNRSRVYKYLQDYTKHFGLENYIHYNLEVTKLSRDQKSGKWVIDVKHSKGEKLSENFEYIIIASGFFKENIAIFDTSAYEGEITYSQKYRDPSLFKDKIVAVIGGSFSGTEIAVDVSKTASKVLHIRDKRFWILPRFLNIENNKIPLDLIFYKRKAENQQDNKNNEDENNQKKHRWFNTLSTQNAYNQMKIPEDQYRYPPYVVISDGYIDSIKSGKIEINECRALKAEGKYINLSNNTSKKVDSIIICSGFISRLPFFSQELLDAISYKEEDQFQPFLLHENMFHLSLPGIVFIGMYRGPYFGVMELQSRWASMALVNPEKYHPSEEEMKIGIERERSIRNISPRPQFPHGDYVNIVDSIAKKIGVFPEEYLNGNKGQENSKMLKETAVIPSQFRIQGPFSNEEMSLRIIEECYKRFFS